MNPQRASELGHSVLDSETLLSGFRDGVLAERVTTQTTGGSAQFFDDEKQDSHVLMCYAPDAVIGFNIAVRTV